jgi:phosphatidylglycerol:prolipoprotein diacylglycerol transferase
METKSYTLFTVLGAIVFAAAALPLLKRAGVKPLRALALIIVMAVAFLVGARLWNFAVNPGAYGGALKWYSLRLAGFSLYGGLLGSAITLLIWARLNQTTYLPILDAMVIPTALAFSLARVGCFLNGCCYGVPTHSALGIDFPVKSGAQEMLNSLLPIGGFTLPTIRYPTQLFELALALLGLIPALLIGRKLKSGSAFLLYGAWFSAARLAILPLRSLPYTGLVKSVVYPALYIALAALGVSALILLNKKLLNKESGGLEDETTKIRCI